MFLRSDQTAKAEAEAKVKQDLMTAQQRHELADRFERAVGER